MENIFHQDLKPSDLDLWMQIIPVPRILDVVAQVLESCQKDNVLSSVHLEDVLPHLCFALPHDAKGCLRVLRSLPLNSSVWDKLEEGLLVKKYLPVEITAILYENRPSALESEMLRVLNQYAEILCSETTSSIAHFKLQDESLDADLSTYSKIKRYQYRYECNNDKCINKKNFWADSPVIRAANHSHSIFSICLQFLCKIVVQSNFSITSVFGSRDFFTEILNMNEELYKAFPPNMQHLVYLLTLPVISGAQSSVVEDALLEALQNEVTIVCILLCFFPCWLPMLEQNHFMDRYLRERCKLQRTS